MKTLLEQQGICRQTTIPYTPEQNWKAEREMRTVKEAARPRLEESNLPKSFWVEAVDMSTYVINRTGTSTYCGR